MPVTRAVVGMVEGGRDGVGSRLGDSDPTPSAGRMVPGGQVVMSGLSGDTER
jgi:hypothetical protein